MCYVLRDKSGFTLFELMVAISMVVLLLTMSSLVYRNTNKRTELIFTAHQVAAMARLAQSYAASAKEFDNSASGQNVWGLSFSKTNPQKVIMFVDKNIANANYGNELYDSGEEYRVLTLPHQINIWKIFKTQSQQEITQEEITQANGAVTVLFSPPDPKTRLCDITAGACASADIVRVVLKDDANDSVKDIKFNFFGLIDVR